MNLDSSSDFSEKDELPPKPKRKYSKREKVTAIMPNGEIVQVDNLTKFMKLHDLDVRNVYQIKYGKRRSVNGINLIWSATPEKLQEALATKTRKKPKRKRTKKTNQKRKKYPQKAPVYSLGDVDHEEFYFRTRIRRHIFTHPKTGIRYQVFSRNRKQSIEQLKFQGIIDPSEYYGDFKIRTYFKSDMCERIIAPNLPIVIWREYDLGMLKKFGFRLGKNPE